MNELITCNGPVVVHAHNILDQSQSQTFRGEGGLSLRQLAPTTKQPFLCIYNGEFVLPEDLDWIPSPEDHVIYQTLPMGGNGNISMQIVGIVLIVVGIYTGNGYLIAEGAGLLIGGLISVPPPVVPLNNANTPSPSPTYDLALSGNSARIGQSIPVLYGRHLLIPDFAAQPYHEYDNSNGDQYYYALLCLGQLDKFTLESVMIDDTDLSHFVDVETQFIGPNFTGSLTLVNAAVVNAPEVANNDLTYGTYVGPFTACGPGLETNRIGIDIICPKGLYYAEDDGSLSTQSTSWMMEARQVNSRGIVSGDWTLLGTHTLSGATNTPIRRSYFYTVPAGRYEVRAQRLDIENLNNRVADAIQWSAMRAYLTVPAPLEPTATFLALKMRANSQLTGLTQRKISVIIRRWLPKWNPITGWSDPVETSSIAWAAADVLRNPVYGPAVPDSRIDLETLYELDLLWAERFDTFNGVFDTRVTVWQALQSILSCGRARPIMRGGVFTFVRDQQQDLPVAMYNMRNIMRGSFSISYAMFNEDTSDGVELAYFDENKWAIDYVRIPMPGVEESLNPVSISYHGITNEAQASRECAYIVADAAYRRSTISFTTEMEGYLPSYGELIAVAHDVAGWGISGDIESWTEPTAICTEDLTWSVGDNYAIIINEQGDPQGPFKVVSGPTSRSMVFLEIPDSGVIYTGTSRERSRFAMGPANSYAKLCRITAINPKPDNTVDITAVVEDNRVHAFDAPYTGDGGALSGGGSGGDSRYAHYAPDGIGTYDTVSDATQARYGFFADEDLVVGSANEPGYKYAY